MFPPGVDITIELAFDGHILDESPDWTDITDYVRGVETARGRNHELDKVEAGTITLVLNNQDGRFNAHNTAGPYYPDLRPATPVRVTVEHDSITYGVWYGSVDQWPVSFPGMVDSVVTVSGSDLFKQLSMGKIGFPTYQSAVLEKGPLAYWRLSGDGTADLSGNGHALQWQQFDDNVTVNKVDGVWVGDEAVDFAGQQLWAATSPGSLIPQPPFTVECWVYPPTASNGGYIWQCRGETSPFYVYVLHYDNNAAAIRFGFRPGGAAPETVVNLGSFDIRNLWNHMFVTFEPVGSNTTRVRLFSGFDFIPALTPQQFGIFLNPAIVGDEQWLIGDRTTSENIISEVAIYPRVLTLDEMNELHGRQLEGFAEETAGPRIASILDNFGLPAARYDLDTGVTVMPRRPSDGSSLTRIQDAAGTDFGVFFINGAGEARFHDRYYRLLEQTTPVATFDEGSGLPYSDLVASVDDTQLWNTVEVSPVDGATAVVRDEDSVDLYMERTLSVSIDPADPTVAADAGTWLLLKYAHPTTRIESLTILPAAAPDDLWPVVLAAEIGDRFRIVKELDGDNLDQEVHLEHIAHSFDASGRWVTTWQLSPADTEPYLILDDAVFGLLDDNKVVY